jgi:uncharacterized RDD family membrane protein YckC
MIKITDLTELKFRTTYKKDAFGNRVRGKEEYIGKRTVRTVKTGPRFGHFFIDILVIQVLVICIQYMLGLLNLAFGFENTVGLTIEFISSISGLLLYPFLYFICEYYWQQTPGKYFTQTIVINEYAEKPNVRQVALRSFVRLVPFEAFSCIGDVYSHGWHDRWSDTFVVKKEELKKLKELQKEQSK